MRRSLLPGLLASARDLNQGERWLALFEQGRTYAVGEARPREAERLAILLCDLAATRGNQMNSPCSGSDDQGGASMRAGGVESRRGGAPWLDRGQVELRAAMGGARLLRPVARRWPRWDLKTVADVARARPGAGRGDATAELRSVVTFPWRGRRCHHRALVELSFAELERRCRLSSETVESVELRARYAGGEVPTDKVRTTLRLAYRHPALADPEESTLNRTPCGRALPAPRRHLCVGRRLPRSAMESC